MAWLSCGISRVGQATWCCGTTITTAELGVIEHTRIPHRLWLVPTVFAGVLGVANAIGAVILLAHTRWTDTMLGTLTVVTAYWFAMGSWRRTPWGLASPDNAPPMLAPLSDRRAMAYVVAALACVLLPLLALGVQVLVFVDR